MKKQISTKDQVLDLLQWSSEEYENRLFNSYWTWCHKYGKYPSIIQQLLANAGVNKWFLIEFSKRESQFIKVASVLPVNDDLYEYYETAIKKIFKLYPKPLLDGINRNRDFSTIFLNNYNIIYYAN